MKTTRKINSDTNKTCILLIQLDNQHYHSRLPMKCKWNNNADIVTDYWWHFCRSNILFEKVKTKQQKNHTKFYYQQHPPTFLAFSTCFYFTQATPGYNSISLICKWKLLVEILMICRVQIELRERTKIKNKTKRKHVSVDCVN